MNQEPEKQVESVRSMLLKNKKPSYQTTSKKEVRVRCPYCGDSKKDKTHAHLYIEMKPPFKFYCQKCTTSGVLNTQTLRDLNIFNSDLSVSILEANKSIKNISGNQKVSFKKHTPILNKIETNFTQNAVNYFNNRYGFNYDNAYIVDKFKAITNSYQFFVDNRIQVPVDRYNRYLYDFNNSIGFLSSDGSHIIFRDITGQQLKRYYNFNMFGDDDKSTSNKIYNIKSAVDIMSDEINLVITEGVFDIIGVYEHFYKERVEGQNNYIFAAAAGKGYNAVIAHYIRMGFLNLNITIYSDADVDPSFFRELKSNSFYLKNTPLTIFYNTKEKDFGIPRDMISLKKVII
jgi:hypothetical protein